MSAYEISEAISISACGPKFNNFLDQCNGSVCCCMPSAISESDAQEARTPVFGDTSPMRRIAAACNELAGSTSPACDRQASSIASLIVRMRCTSSAAAAASVAELLEPPCGSEKPPLERYHALSEHLRLAHSIVDIFDDARARVDGTEFRSMPLLHSLQ